MMTKGKLLIVIGMFLVILTGARLIWIVSFSSTDQPNAVNGVMDLRKWDAAEGRTLTLDGQWEFYPSVMLMNSGGLQGSYGEKAKLIQVPGNWDDFLRPGEKTPYGYGSYRLRVLVDPGINAIYSIRVPSVRSSSELYVNGHLLAKSGQPAMNEEEYTARNVPYTASFATGGEDVVEIVIQAANYTDSRESGIVRSMKFGTEEAIARETNLSVAMQQIVAVIFLIHAVYALILFFMGYRDKKLLFFSLLFLCAILSILVGGEDKILLYWFPLNLEISFDIMSMIMFVGAISVIQSVMDQLSVFWRTRIFPAFALGCGAAMIIELILPARYSQNVNNLFLTFVGIFVLLAIMSMLRTLAKGIKENLLLLLSLIALANNFVWWGVFLASGIKIVYYPFDLIAAAICFASVWFKRYLQVYSETKQQAAKLQKADKLKDEFLANTSHELRNPLHGIINISQAVLEREMHSLSGKSVKDLETVLSVGRRMTLMLNDLLDAMRLKDSNPRLQLGHFSLQTVVTGVLDMLQFMTEGKPIRLTNQLSDGFPQVLADENRVIQIIFNLLHNALKNTSEGEVAVRGFVIGDRAQIVISDTGIGMDEETTKRVFEPYEQAPSDKTMIEGGFGLGLSISKQLAELHGGTVEVRSTPGQGSEFSFTLQLSDPSVSREETATGFLTAIAYAESAAAASSGQLNPSPRQELLVLADRPRILIVDDDPINLNVLENILTSERYDIVAVTSGKEALVLMDSREWDLVISDVMMPLMSGYELSRMIRMRFTITELPVLLLTARSRPEDIENGFRSGANDYVTKPVDAMELRSRVHALTEVKKSARDRLRMEAAWLQAQIQPHFLFNTLNTVAALSEIDTNRMRELLAVFGDFLKDKFKFQNIDELVPIEYELELVRSYLHIEKERFDERLQVIWEIDEGNRTWLIPPLTIQPLVENAVRHGIMKRARGGEIRIRLSDHGTYAELSVIDDGVGIDEDKLGQILDASLTRTSGIGLFNTDLRLKRHFGSGLQIKSDQGSGTLISFIVRK